MLVMQPVQIFLFFFPNKICKIKYQITIFTQNLVRYIIFSRTFKIQYKTFNLKVFELIKIDKNNPQFIPIIIIYFSVMKYDS